DLPTELDDGPRRFDPDDPLLDTTTGLATRAQFEAAIERYDADEATLVVVAVDDFETLVERSTTVVVDRVALELADRMVAECRRGDVVARLDAGSFAILLSDASRAVGLQIAKRLLDAIARPLDIDGGPEGVTATVALAHQFGLVDMEELVESADQAVLSGKRAGPGRLVIAS
ncbi:MAG: GGDEF domain-containing protein, partial [Ilumatobacter sp.]